MPVADLVEETTSANSTASIPLQGAVGGSRRFSAVWPVGTTPIPVMVRSVADPSIWESAAYTLSAANTLTRQTIYDSSNGGNAVVFPAGQKTVSCSPCAKWFDDFARLSDGLTAADLPSGTPVDADVIAFNRPGSGDLKATVAAWRSIFGGTAPPADTTAPSFPDALSSSSVTQTSFTLAWQAATDANGIARYEYSYDGSTWTTAGTALSVNLTGRTAGTTYTVRVRALDPSGNVSTVRTLAVTTAAASGDTQAPSMSGSISTSNITSSGYTFSWTAGTDNVAVDHYETSIDGGASWQSIAAGTLSRTVTGRPASTTDNLRVRAHDAAGNISNVLSGTVTTSSATVTPYTITGLNGNAVKSTIDGSTAIVSGSKKYIPASGTTQTTVGIYWNVVNSNTGVKAPSARSGWFPLGYTPTSADFITDGQNQSGATSVNGLRPMGSATGNAFGNNSILWLDVGAGTVTMCFWICGENGAPMNMNPSGTVITGV